MHFLDKEEEPNNVAIYIQISSSIVKGNNKEVGA